MNRRDFLKLGGMLSTAALLGRFVPLNRLLNRVQKTSFDVETTFRGMRYRGSTDGKVYTSLDAGKTWDHHTYFGSDYSVLGLFTNLEDQLIAEIGFFEHSFNLRLSENTRDWETIV